jgi:hypothetical protein
MRRLWIIPFLMPVGAFATLITDPVPLISTACTVDNAQVACGTATSPDIYGTQRVGADTSFTMTGLNTDTGLFIQAIAEASAGGVSSTQLTDSSSAIASVTLDFLGSTGGPERSGFATYVLIADGDHGAGAGAGALVSVAGIGSCQYPDCATHGTLLPFELGVPFEVDLSVFGSGGSGIHVYDGGGAVASIQLQLFDADGTPVAIFDPPADVPEPGSALLITGSLIALVALRRLGFPKPTRA